MRFKTAMRILIPLLMLAVVASAYVRLQLFEEKAANASAPPAPPTTQEEPAPLTTVPSRLDDEWETVGGFEFRKSANCREHRVVREDGSVSEGILCDDAPKPRHRYADIDIDTLRDMAYRDSEAAEIVAVKLGERGDLEEGLSFAFRAVALHARKSPRALNRFHNTFYARNKYLDDASGDFVVDTDNATQRYIMERVKDALHGTNAALFVKRTLIEEAGYTANDIEKLDAKVVEALEFMAQVEIEVVGNNSIKKRVNA